MKDTYKAMYPTSCTHPKFYGLPKIHNIGTPSALIVSSRGSVTPGMTKVLAKVLKLLVGRVPYHIQSTRDFVNRLKGVTLLPGECLCSYDVTTLFTSASIDPALGKIKDLLEQDDTSAGWNSIASTEYYWTLRVLSAQLLTSLSKKSFMNKLKELQWVLQ